MLSAAPSWSLEKFDTPLTSNVEEHFTPLFMTSEKGVSQTKQVNVFATADPVVRVKEEVLMVTDATFIPLKCACIVRAM